MAQIPSTIRIENGQVFDQSSNQRMDLSKPEFSVLQQAISQRGDISLWNNGEYRFDTSSNSLIPTSSGNQSATGGSVSSG